MFQACYCYPNGAPTSVCDSMLPDHNNEPQSVQSPFLVNAIYENGQVKVNVGDGATNFKGILIEARDATDKTKIIDGTFSFDSSQQVKTLNCKSGTKNAVTHASRDLKSKVDVIWTPPNGFSGNTIFKATVVKDYSDFWMNLDSESVEITASSNPATEATTNPPSHALYEGCGSEYGCFGYPEGCIESKSCAMLVKFITSDGNTMFDLISVADDDADASNSYVALGFSKDDSMGDDSVVACINYNSAIQAKTGWNYMDPDLGNSLNPTNLAGFSVLGTSYEDGILKCSFKHPNKWIMENVDFNFNDTTHLLLALGTAQSATGELLKKYKILFLNAQEKAERLESVYDNCGKTKGCFAEPSNCISTKDCDAFVSFTRHEEGVQFDLIGKSDNGYVAVGLSSDDKMGDDSVTTCMLKNNVVEVKQAWNVDKPGKTSNILSSPEVGISQTSGTYQDGTILCQFIRGIKTSIEGNTFDLNSTEYFLLLAVGPVGNGNMEYHDKRWVSASALKLTSASLVKGNTNLMAKIHGMLMIMAWVGTASIGMLLARYFKSVWSDKLLTGVKVWFFYHRVLMVLTVLLTASAFIVIFVDIGGLSQVGKNPHPYLGIATTALCMIQPFLALCRCAPDDSKRPIFNWLHWFIGNAAQILGVVTIFFAVELAKANLPQYFDWILVAFILFHLLFHMILQAMACKNDGKSKMSDIQMSSYGTGPDGASNMNEQKNTEVQGASGRKMTLFTYVFFNIGFVAALVAIIWIS
ncbi:putative ferric-chelate reductase 1 [Nymphon striatum]|nr:putative ferric-chelate reductase 1 [Nymphon striatum]